MLSILTGILFVAKASQNLNNGISTKKLTLFTFSKNGPFSLCL